ncbi:MAG: YhfC family intramembrane metalloprotease [Anaerolineae bacterium]|nr:YhfC family intramembrane metalloprotease [Anaerolineae bacterium]
MLVYGVVILAVGISLLAAALITTSWLHRRFGVSYALLTVGVITYVGALIAQVVLLRLFDRALLGILPLGALAVGLVAGFSEETARLLGFQYLARSTVTRPQALMIGAGHAFTEAIYTALVAVGIGLSLITENADPADDLGAVLSGAVAEAFNGLLPVIMSVALSWMVLQALLRGQFYWLFVAIFCHAVVEITATLLGPSDAWAVVIWRGIVAALGLLVLVRIKPTIPSSQVQPSDV